MFLKDRDILLAGDKWKISLEVALDEHIKLIQGVQEAIVNVTESIPKIDDELYLFLGGTEIQIGNAKERKQDLRLHINQKSKD